MAPALEARAGVWQEPDLEPNPQARALEMESEVGGENRSEAEVPHRESKPSAHAHATHDTTDQSGAISSGG